MKRLLSLMFIVLVSLVTYSQTNLSQEEFNKLPLEVQKQITDVKAVSNATQQIEVAGKWVGFGKEVGTAVNESLKAVTQTAVDFSETKLGKITIWLVIYKVIGEDIVQIGFGFLWIILLLGITLFIYRNYARDKRVVIKETYNPDTKKYDKEWEIIRGDSDYKGASVVIMCVGLIAAVPMFLTIGG